MVPLGLVGAGIVGDVSVPAVTVWIMFLHADFAKASLVSRSSVRLAFSLAVSLQFMFVGSGQPKSVSPVDGIRELPHKADGVLFGLKLFGVGGPVAPNTAL